MVSAMKSSRCSAPSAANASRKLPACIWSHRILGRRRRAHGLSVCPPGTRRCRPRRALALLASSRVKRLQGACGTERHVSHRSSDGTSHWLRFIRAWWDRYVFLVRECRVLTFQNTLRHFQQVPEIVVVPKIAY